MIPRARAVTFAALQFAAACAAFRAGLDVEELPAPPVVELPSAGVRTLPSGNPLLQGWRWVHFETNFAAPSSNGGPVDFEGFTVTYTSDI